MDNSDQSNEFKLLCRAVSRAKLYIVLGGFFGLVLAVLFTWVSVPQYRASMMASRAEWKTVKLRLPGLPTCPATKTPIWRTEAKVTCARVL